ncbi:MAG: MarR family transcriptional regulator [Bacteroidales bacterium]|jgi:DNA-binding MarR family transcriptional regulator|nr:MarR family transcriptional regulator [Bacteroidales bacterium]MDY0254456.1 MarR family transcriptional regulator [Tenuifilaceae bacterium]
MRIEDEIKGRFRNEYHKGFINLSYTARSLSYDFFRELKKHGLTEQQYNVLRILRGFKDEAPLNVGFIKERMLDRNPDVSRLVDRLQEKGLVTSSSNSLDKRQRSVDITPRGLDLLASLLAWEKHVETLLGNLTLDEVTELNRILDKIRE